MRILLATGIYPPEIGGPAGYTHSLAKALAAQGDRVSVLTYGDTQTVREPEVATTAVSRSGGPLVRYVRYAFHAWHLARSHDVVYLQGPVSEGLPGTIGAILAGKRTVMKIVGDYAWEVYQQHGGNMELLDTFVTKRHGGPVRVLEWIERWTARHASTVIVPSAYLKRIVMGWGVPESKTRVIYNSVPALPQTQDREALRSRLGCAERQVVLTAVRAVPWKRVDFLIEAFVGLSASSLLVIAGDGPCLEDWKRLAQAKGLGERIRFLGRIDRKTLAEWYRAADVFALPSSYEGFPYVVAEAVSTGLPCLVSDRGGNPETRELYPDHVRILPLEDLAAWREALGQPHLRLAPFENETLSFAMNVRKVREICAS